MACEPGLTGRTALCVGLVLPTATPRCAFVAWFSGRDEPILPNRACAECDGVSLRVAI